MRILVLLLWVGLCQQTVAAVANTPGNTDAKSQQPLSEQQLTELIATLESPTARKVFVEKLKTLQAAQAEESDQGLGINISETLQLGDTTEKYVTSFLQTLDQWGLNQSELGRAVASLGILLGAALLMVLHKQGLKWAGRKTQTLRERYRLSHERLRLLIKIQRFFGYTLLLILLFYSLTTVWNLSPGKLAPGFSFSNMVENYLIVMLIVIVAANIWEFFNAAMEFQMQRNQRLQTARAQTFIPIVRNVLMFVVVIMTLLTLMSELGIDIMPLLAGAGVLGIAVGFGAQTLVKDFLTGFTIILEDLLQIGDVVGLADRVGVVERITIRKIQLRALDGTVHTVPFSEISIVDNLTKHYAYYLMDIGVAYREDIDEVIECLQEIDAGMREEDDYREKILEPIDIMGVDRFADSAVIVRARLKTRGSDKWSVGREFNHRMKKAFDQRGIEIPFPHQTLYFGQDKQGHAPKANVALFNANDAKAQADSEASSRHQRSARYAQQG